MTAKLTEKRIEEIRKSPYCRDSEWQALCDAALEHVRARGQKPAATVIGLNSRIDAHTPLPVGTLLYTTPQPTYRDGLLAAAKVCDGYAGTDANPTTLANELRALADKEG